MLDPRRTESTQGAVELMTAWLAVPDGPPDLVLEFMQRGIEEHPSGNRLIGAAELIMGLTHLCGSVLLLREFEDGVSAEQTIQDLALGLASDMSDD